MHQSNCKWLGHSFEVHSANNVTWNDVPGIYIFSAPKLDKWHPFYVGQASSFLDRLNRHERWDEAQRLGASHIHAIVVHDQERRDTIERNLIAWLQPALNTQHKGASAQANGIFANPSYRAGLVDALRKAAPVPSPSLMEQTQALQRLALARHLKK